MECFEGMIGAESQLRDAKRAVQYAQEMDAAAEQPVDHTRAKLLLARAVLGTVNIKSLTLTCWKTRTAHCWTPNPRPSAYFYDGRVLALLRRDENAAAAFRRYAEKTTREDALLPRAHHFAVRPEFAREDMAPALAVTTLAGKHFTWTT